MQSSLIGKIEKARIYAEERERVNIGELSCQMRGDNSTHAISLRDGAWTCDCSFFGDYGTCSHAMAMQRILNEMLPETAKAAYSAA